LEIDDDSSDAPGTIVGGATNSFAGPAADGFIGDKSLTSNAAQTINNPYWVRMKRVSGSSLDASNHVQFESSAVRPNREKMRHFNGTNWTTTSPVNNAGLVVLTHADGTMTGFAITNNQAASAQTDIFGTNRQGIRLKYGSQVKLAGVGFNINKSGSPSNLQIKVYEGSTEKTDYATTLTAAEVTSATRMRAFFNLSVVPFLAADTNLYIVLQQVSDGGDNSNDYDLRTWPASSGIIAGMWPADMRMVAGTGNDPTALSVITTEYPTMWPIFSNPAAQFDIPGAEAGYLMGVM
jgi:hypothetical protein